MKTLLETNGRVEWWLYSVSHGQLLLRRQKSSTRPRLDILFKNVAEAHLVAFFDDLRVVEGEPADNLDKTPASLTCRIYRLIGDNAVGHIVASSMIYVEDDGEYDEPSSLMKME